MKSRETKAEDETGTTQRPVRLVRGSKGAIATGAEATGVAATGAAATGCLEAVMRASPLDVPWRP